MERSRLLWTMVATLACTALLGSAAATADTIHLENGRVIHARQVSVEGDRVVFSQHGASQAIPLERVTRVVKDDRVGAGEAARAGGKAARAAARRQPLATSLPPRAQSVAPGIRREPSLLPAAPNDGLPGLAGLLNSATGAVEPGQALGLLQAISGAGGGEAGLGALLGALGQGTGVGLGAGGGDLGRALTLLPALTRLGQALFAPDYSREQGSAAVDEMLQALAAAGVSDEKIASHARSFGVSPEVLGQAPRARRPVR